MFSFVGRVLEGREELRNEGRKYRMRKWGLKNLEELKDTVYIMFIIYSHLS